MEKDSILKKHGDNGTFVVRIKYCQNYSWQGVVTWAEKQKTVPFRPALELVHLIDGALAEEGAKEEPREFADKKEQSADD